MHYTEGSYEFHLLRRKNADCCPKQYFLIVNISKRTDLGSDCTLFEGPAIREDSDCTLFERPAIRRHNLYNGIAFRCT
jgi:hypothetical protein